MINNEKTQELFGYLPSSLSKSSLKKVCVVCDYCGIEYTPLNRNYKTGRLKGEQYGIIKDACSSCGQLKAVEIEKSNGSFDESRRKRLENCKKTMISRYGVENPSQIKGHREKINKKNSEKSKEEILEIKRKREETMVKRHGSKFGFNSKKNDD